MNNNIMYNPDQPVYQPCLHQPTLSHIYVRDLGPSPIYPIRKLSKPVLLFKILFKPWCQQPFGVVWIQLAKTAKVFCHFNGFRIESGSTYRVKTTCAL